MSSSHNFIKDLREKGVSIRTVNLQIGGNSKLYHFELEGMPLVLKVYSGDNARKKESRERESMAYKFLRENGFLKLPELYDRFLLDDGICLQFINGNRPGHNRRTSQEILDSFSHLHETYISNQSFSYATDAAFSTEEIVKQIERRMSIFDSQMSTERDLMLNTLNKLKSIKPIEFPASSLTYSFSDVGPHNMIKAGDKYYFVDLEFFGKDSAIKMIIDYLLHPRNRIMYKDKMRTIELAEKDFGANFELLTRVTPFLAAKWATIIARRMTLKYREQRLFDLRNSFRRYLNLANMSDLAELQVKLLKPM